MKRNDDVGDLAICILASEGGLNGGKRGFNQQKLGYKTSQGVDSGYIYIYIILNIPIVIGIIIVITIY